MAKSLAFWLEEPKTETPREEQKNPTGSHNTSEGEPVKSNSDTSQVNATKIELHFNHWSLDITKYNAIDIGVKFSDTNFEAINIYFPFNKYKIKYVSHLGHQVAENNELLSAIFNSQVSKIELGAVHTDIVFSGNESETLRFFTEITRNDHDGVSLTGIQDERGVEQGFVIKFPKQLLDLDNTQNIEGYFRFRIILDSESAESISRQKAQDWSWTNFNFDATEMVDFRINEIRNLPGVIKRQVKDSSCIRCVHLFLIRDANAKHEMSNPTYKRCRLLEEDLWTQYLQVGKPSSPKKTSKKGNQYLIYHLNQRVKEDNQNSLKNFSAFAKYTRRNIRKRDLLGGIVITAFIGGTASLAASRFEDIIWPSPSNNIQFEASQLSSLYAAVEDKVGNKWYFFCRNTQITNTLPTNAADCALVEDKQWGKADAK